jgi:hypothetical protein
MDLALYNTSCILPREIEFVELGVVHIRLKLWQIKPIVYDILANKALENISNRAKLLLIWWFQEFSRPMNYVRVMWHSFHEVYFILNKTWGTQIAHLFRLSIAKIRVFWYVHKSIYQQ